MAWVGGILGWLVEKSVHYCKNQFLLSSHISALLILWDEFVLWSLVTQSGGNIVKMNGCGELGIG